MKARVFVTLKPSVFDPQGQTIADALHSMGYAGIADVRQGKFFELDVDAGSAEEARALVAEVADKVLANPVIESYRVEVAQASAGAPDAAAASGWPAGGESPQATASAQRGGDGQRGPAERSNR
jgi:phosphoribosylformylglycinamidine synthase